MKCAKPFTNNELYIETLKTFGDKCVFEDLCDNILVAGTDIRAICYEKKSEGKSCKPYENECAKDLIISDYDWFVILLY